MSIYINPIQKVEIFNQILNLTRQVKLLESKVLFDPLTTDYLNSDELIEWLGINMRTLQYWRETNTIPYTAIGRKYYYKIADIKECLKEGSIENLNPQLPLPKRALHQYNK
jgi:hypothetical protein